LLIRTGVTFFSIRASTYFASIPFLANTSSRGLAAPKMEEDAVVELLTACWERGLSCDWNMKYGIYYEYYMQYWVNNNVQLYNHTFILETHS
jgi:hypothetical protein